ncbi:hypothetical protein DOM21_01110 [Bacteriovorax stolpii]|uniref:glycosyltransferase family 39 protein n=1 Tax=Bacteriovorax stolpii TaxID=960 RepID=UPI00115C0D09|nr:glycosyltransferase family 39 protein [Bacteriovorax stolpii]QDK40078.1 hypothetical protein DOM21_01110 [Bacteriovorax stolpii]
MLKQDLFQTEQSQKRAFYCLWGFVIFVYLFFNIKIHMHESYVYSGAMEGFFDVTHGHYGVSPWLVNYNAFGNYHPDHPLLHLLGKLLKDFLALFSIQLLGIKAVSSINTITGLMGGFFFYKIMKRFTKDQIFATLMTVVLMFTDIFWFGAKSGEGYTSGQCFNLLSMYLIFKYIEERKTSYIVYQAISLGVAMAFHSLFVFMLIPQFLIFWRADRKNILKVGSIIFAIIFAFGMAFYILPLYFYIGAKSLGEMIKVFLFYSDEMGVWTKSAYSLFSIVWGLILYPFVTGVYHLIYTVLEGYHAVWLFFRLVLIVIGYKALKMALRDKAHETRFMLCWFAIYFIFTSYILFLPYDITYWLFLMPAFIFILSFYFKKLKYRNAWALGLATLLFTGNFINDIYPKMIVNEDKYFFVDKISEEMKDESQMAIIIFDSFAETSYLNYFGIVWAIKHHPSFADKHIEIIVDNVELDRKLQELTKDGKKLFVLRNSPGEAEKVEPMNKAIADIGYKLVKKTELRHHFNEKLDKTSEFQHVEAWYDLGPVGQSWLMHLALYEKN